MLTLRVQILSSINAKQIEGNQSGGAAAAPGGGPARVPCSKPSGSCKPRLEGTVGVILHCEADTRTRTGQWNTE